MYMLRSLYAKWWNGCTAVCTLCTYTCMRTYACTTVHSGIYGCTAVYTLYTAVQPYIAYWGRVQGRTALYTLYGHCTGVGTQQ